VQTPLLVISLTFLNKEGQVAIYDGANINAKERARVKSKLEDSVPGVQLVWIESECTDEKVIEDNIRKTKLFSPDYLSIDPSEAVKDFRNRIKKFAEIYEPLSYDSKLDKDTSFIKLIDVGREVFLNQIHGYLSGKIVSFLMNLHIQQRPLYFTRHGESQYNELDKIGGDSGLTARGMAYAKLLPKFLRNLMVDNDKLSEATVFCSTLKRSKDTAQEIAFISKPICLKILDEINVGVCDGMTYADVKKFRPEDFEYRTKDKLRYRYPRGESYLDLIHRIEPVIFEIERLRDPVIVVGHQAILRCLYGYFANQAIEDIPHIDIPLHTVIELTPKTYGFMETRYFIDVETGKWHATKVPRNFSFKFDPF